MVRAKSSCSWPLLLLLLLLVAVRDFCLANSEKDGRWNMVKKKPKVARREGEVDTVRIKTPGWPASLSGVKQGA